MYPTAESNTEDGIFICEVKDGYDITALLDIKEENEKFGIEKFGIDKVQAESAAKDSKSGNHQHCQYPPTKYYA